MNAQTRDHGSGKIRLMAAAGAIFLLLFPMGYSVASYLAHARAVEQVRPFLERPAPQIKECLDDAAYMRFHHMDLIKEIRDAGVRGGAIRSTSFASCRGCHVSRTRFCTRCHLSVNLKPDCFHCHYYP